MKIGQKKLSIRAKLTVRSGVNQCGVELWVEPQMPSNASGLLETPASDLRAPCKSL
jgi:hypothetical protein